MWFRRHLPIFIALSASVALHWVSFRGARLYQVKLRATTSAHKVEEETTIQLSLLDPPAPKPDDPEKAKKPDPDKPRKPEKPAPKKPQVKFPDEMGERSGKGIGSNNAEGIEPLKALEADEDQAFLSRNPGARGMANRPANRLMLPGENGRGGHPGSPTPPGKASSASDDVPVPADPLAAQSPHPQESDPAPDATPPAPPDLPAPRAKVETATDDAAEPAEPTRPQPAPPVQARVQPKPAQAIGSVPTDPLKLSPVSVGPKVSPTPPKSGDDAIKGSGQASIQDEPSPLPKDPAAGLRRTSTQPSREAGHVDGAQVALQLPIPFIEPTRTAEAHEAPPKPAYALLVTPPSAVAPTLESPQPTIKPTPPEKPDVSKEAPKPAAAPRKPPADPSTSSGHSPPAPSAPAPAAGASASAQATGDGHQPGSDRPHGEPGQMSDSESDPFSKIGSAQVLHDGKLDVRFGRKIKTVRPHIPVVGLVDSFAMLNPSVTLKVSIDATGKVTEVAVHKSSGSNEIDQPTLIAMYDWWFEPLHDAKGNAVPDCVLFTINFR